MLLTLHTGKHPGVLCGIKLDNIYQAKEFVAEKTGDRAFRLQVIPACEYALYKTVPVSFMHVSKDVLLLLEVLSMLREIVDAASEDACLLTSVRDKPLMHIDNIMKKAWKDAGCQGRFNSTMMHHTIVTAARDPKNKLTEEELKALARGMDHSVRIAEDIYYNEKEKRQIDHSAIIQKVLNLNDWDADLKLGVEEEIELQAMTGELELLESEMIEDEGDGGEGSKKGKKKKRMIANSEVIFDTDDAILVRQLFERYINHKVENPKASIIGKEIKKNYYAKTRDLPKKSKFIKLFKYDIEKIVTKVRTIITAEKRKKRSEEKRKKLQRCMLTESIYRQSKAVSLQS